VNGYSAPFIFDLNGDSLPDLVVGRQDGGLSYYWNTGTKTNPHFSDSSMNSNFGHVNVAVSPDIVGYSQPYIFRDTGGLKLLVGNKLGYIYEYLIDTSRLQAGSFTLVTKNFLNNRIGNQATISAADINGDGRMEYLIGNSRGGLVLYSDSNWDPGTTLGLNTISDKQAELRVFPNPAGQYFYCSIDNIEFINPQTEVFDLLGRKMNIEVRLLSKRVSISANELPTGFYIVRVNDLGKIYTGKVLIQR
jgi:hypothetical protein